MRWRYFGTGRLGLILRAAPETGYHYLAAAAGSFVLSVIVNFFLGREFVFKNQCKFNINIEALSILALNTTGLLLDLLLIAVAIELGRIYPLTAKIGATGLVFIWNFSMRRWWLYRPISAG